MQETEEIETPTPQSSPASKYSSEIDHFTLMDNAFMRTCFQDNIPAAQTVVRIVLNDPQIVVTSVETERVMQNLKGRSIWLDTYAKDDENKKYDIEIQRADKGATPAAPVTIPACWIPKTTLQTKKYQPNSKTPTSSSSQKMTS